MGGGKDSIFGESLTTVALCQKIKKVIEQEMKVGKLPKLVKFWTDPFYNIGNEFSKRKFVNGFDSKSCR